MTSSGSVSPRAITAIGVFFVFGATMACIAGTTLLFPGSALDRMWALNPSAYNELTLSGRPVGISFLLLAVALAFAAVGWFRRRNWGWRLAVVIIGIQILGDFVNVIRGRLVQGTIGVVLAGALLTYILRPKTKGRFSTGKQTSIG